MSSSQDAYEYNARRKDIDNLISELQEALALKDKVFEDNEDYQHVADLNYIREQLTNAAKHAKSSLDKW